MGGWREWNFFGNTQNKCHRMIKLKAKFHTTVLLNCGVRERKSTKGQNGVAFLEQWQQCAMTNQLLLLAHGRNHPPRCTLRGPLLCFPSVWFRRCPAFAACWHKREQQSIQPWARQAKHGAAARKEEKGSHDECVRTAGETDEDALGVPGDKGALVSGWE